jgi:hypothetical protein
MAKETAGEKFDRIAPERTRAVRESLRKLGNLTHPYGYEATEEQWRDIFARIEGDLEELKEAARAQLRTQKRRASKLKSEEGMKPAGGFSVDEKPGRPKPFTAE